MPEIFVITKEIVLIARLVTGETFVTKDVRIIVMEMCVIMKMVDVYKDAF